MGDFLKFIGMFANIIKINNFQGLFYLALLLLSGWLFKEFRKTKIELDIANRQKINDALQTYGNAIISLKKYRANKVDEEQVIGDLAAVYQYATRDIIDIISNLEIKGNSENYKEIYTMLNKEVVRLKSLQYDCVSFKNDYKYIDSLSFYYKKNNFSLFIGPLANVVISVACILLMIVFVASYDNANLLSSFISIMRIMGVMYYILVLMAIGDLITNNKFKITFSNCMLTALLLFSPAVFKIPNKLISAMVFIGCLIVYTVFIIIKKTSRQASN